MFRAKNCEDIIEFVTVICRMIMNLFPDIVCMLFTVITEVLSCRCVLKFDEDSDIDARQRTFPLRHPRCVVDKDNLCPQSLCDGRVMENSAAAMLNSNSGHTLRSTHSSTFQPPTVLSSFT